MKKFMPLVINSLFFVVLYFGFFKEIEGAKNIALAYIWLYILVGLLYLKKDAKVPEKSQYIKIPKSIKISLAVVTTLVLIWFGYWWTGSLYAFAAMIFIQKSEEVKKEEEIQPQT